MAEQTPTLRARQRLDKYRVVRRIGRGGFADVYEAYDTIEGVRVALKIPHSDLIDQKTLRDFRNEVRLTAGLEHSNILPIKTAGFIGDRFVIVYPLGQRTLADRLTSRLSTRTALNYAEQILEAVAFAHQKRIIHCDVKPANYILFAKDRVRLADFGIAKVALRTLSASGAGTLGYVAPEQAMGKPSFRSDVFSVGLILYQMFSGKLPKWPYEWPPAGLEKLKAKLPREMIALIRRAIEVDERKRFENAGQMLAAYQRLKRRTMNHGARRRRARRKTRGGPDWKTIRLKEFQKRYGKALDVGSVCAKCSHPIGESMSFCPWCGFKPKVHRGHTRFPARCNRCGRGMKLDWRFCAWCYGAGVEPDASRQYSDVRYEARCANRACKRKDLMPFMRYCPWCRIKVQRKWKIPGSDERCTRCGWGVVREFWDGCPWCGKAL